MKWYLSCDVGNGLIDAIWRLMMEDGLKYAVRGGVDRYCISYSVKIICHLAILPERVGFSNMYLIGSILDINKVVWVNMYCLSRRESHAKEKQVFSSSEYLVSQSINFLLR